TPDDDDVFPPFSPPDDAMNMAVLPAQPEPAAPSRAAEAEPLVRLTGVTKRFDGHGAAAVTAVDEVDMIAPRGSITAIIGRSGAGKSTLVRLINGLEKPTSGSIVVGGVE